MQRNTIHQLDCIAGMHALPASSVDLAFADPPFNIGYEYDVYQDRKDDHAYLDWSQEWIAGVYRALKPTGSFWLAIGDDYAAELKLLSQRVGFHCRSWVVWYYTFGVNCKRKFSRSHTHIFHFVKDPNEFQFNGQAIAVPSARQLVYADARANKSGRLPDDTWILRPQDVTDGFNPDDDVWYFPRVAGTFKEREGFHGCQMPEQLLGRIVRVSSNPGDLVLDPFSGSSTTLVVAKKLGREFIGFDISEDYIQRGLARLAACAPGDPLDGSPEPTVSAPATPSGDQPKQRKPRGAKAKVEPIPLPVVDLSDRRAFDQAVVAAFQQSSEGYSVDRVVADPQLDRQFVDACRQGGLQTTAVHLNRALFRLRKAGKLQAVVSNRRTEFDWRDADRYLFASEIAWKTVSDRHGSSLDDILCDPELAAEFDRHAAQFAAGYSSLHYRWGALKLRKVANVARHRARQLREVALSDAWSDSELLRPNAVGNVPGVYLICDERDQPLYAGGTLDLKRRLEQHCANEKEDAWRRFGSTLRVSAAPYSVFELPAGGTAAELGPWLVACQFRLIEQWSPRLNSLVPELNAV